MGHHLLKRGALALTLCLTWLEAGAQAYPYFPPPGIGYNATTGNLTLQNLTLDSVTGIVVTDGASGVARVATSADVIALWMGACSSATLLGGGGACATVTIPVGATPTGTIGLTAVAGSAATFTRSDGAPALSQAIVPTWTGIHTFTESVSGSPIIVRPAVATFAEGPELIDTQSGGHSYGWIAGFNSGPQAGTVGLFDYTTSVTRLAVNSTGGVLMPNLAASSSATTGTVCWATGTGILTVDTTTTCLLSSARFKQRIRALENGLGDVMRLRPVSYELRPEFDPYHLGRQVGFIAEEVARVDPRLVALDDAGQPRAVRYLQMTSLLVQAVQQQQYEIYGLAAALAAALVTLGVGIRRGR